MTDEKDEAKVAIDVKTTYRNFTANGEWTASFTLGSYTSFMRNETKISGIPIINIQSITSLDLSIPAKK